MDNKNISTIVKDIYKVLEDRSARIDTETLAKMFEARLKEVKQGPALRMSSIGEKCIRKLWYRENKPEVADKLPGHTLLKFLTGDLKEELVLSLAEQAGHKVEARQEEVEFEGVKGHIDAIIDGTLIDVKSANSRGMGKFKEHKLESDDPFGYLDQLGIYHAALQEDKRLVDRGSIAFLAADKELGHIVLDTYPVRKRDWKSVIQSIREALKRKDPPERFYTDEPDGKSGNRQIQMPCRYCEFKKTCWADSNRGSGLREFIYSNGPRFLTKIMRTPDVVEIKT